MNDWWSEWYIANCSLCFLIWSQVYSTEIIAWSKFSDIFSRVADHGQDSNSAALRLPHCSVREYLSSFVCGLHPGFFGLISHRADFGSAQDGPAQTWKSPIGDWPSDITICKAIILRHLLLVVTNSVVAYSLWKWVEYEHLRSNNLNWMRTSIGLPGCACFKLVASPPISTIFCLSNTRWNGF